MKGCGISLVYLVLGCVAVIWILTHIGPIFSLIDKGFKAIAGG